MNTIDAQPYIKYNEHNTRRITQLPNSYFFIMQHKQAPWEFIEQYYIDDLNERNTIESNWSTEWLTHIRGKNILSIGCGPNFYDDVQFFSNVPQKFVGIDINQNNFEFLKNSTHPELLKWKKYLEEYNVAIEFLLDDIRNERKEFYNSFDTIYGTGVFGMFSQEDISKIFQLIYKYLKVGGLFIDIDWTEPRLSGNKIIERAQYQWFKPQDISMNEIIKLLKQNQFVILKKDVLNVSDPNQYMWGKIYGVIAQKK